MAHVEIVRKVHASFEAVSRVLGGAAGELVPGPPESDDKPVFEVAVGGTIVERPVEFEVGEYVEVVEPIAAGVVPVRVHAVEEPGWFPALDAEISVVSIAPASVEVALEGRYSPPGGIVGATIDTVILHRVASAAVDRWFEGFVARLQRESAAMDAMLGVPV